MSNIALPAYRHRSPVVPLPGWLQTEFVNIEQKIPGSAARKLWPYAILPGEVGVVAQIYPVGDVRRYGAIGDGSADDTVAFMSAIESAIAARFGTVYVPSGYRFRITSTLYVPSAIWIYGQSQPAGGIAGLPSVGTPALLHDFDGTLIEFNGANGSIAGSGGGVASLRLAQVAGTGITPAGKGTAIKITGVDPSHRASWTRIEAVTIENSFGDTWSTGIHIDGLTAGALMQDLSVRFVTAHIDNTGGNGNFIKMDWGSCQFINCTGYQAGANVRVSGASGKPSSSSGFYGCNIAGSFDLDYASNIQLVGGIVTSMTDTANTGGTNILFPGYLSNPFTSLAGGATVALTYQAATRVLASSQKLGGRGGLASGNTAAAATLGTVVGKQPLYDMTGTLVGYVPIYDAIT